MPWRSWGWYALAVAVMAAVTADVILDGPLRRLDHTVHRFADTEIHGVGAAVVFVVTQLGQRGVLVKYALIPLAVIAAIRARSLRPPAVAVLVVVLLSLLQDWSKSLVPRTFPSEGRDVVLAHGTAYPSGHTLNGFLLTWVGLELLAIAVPALDRPLPPHRRYAVAMVLGALTGIALTLADEHWLTDVLFSLALGPVLLTGLVAAAPFTRPLRPHRRRAAYR